MAKNRVELGYVEEADPSLLQSPFFPSKVGGRPAWLSYEHVPGPEQLRCSSCGDPLAFLLQVYAPVQDRADCFHRSLFVFVCRNPACSKTDTADNFLALRSQLPRVNAFYDDRPLDPSGGPEALTKLKSLVTLCEVCGCSCADHISCAQCKVFCCSEQHRTLHVREAHQAKKQINGKQGSGLGTLSPQKFLFPEFELVTETEEYYDEKKSPERSKEERMKAYQEFVRSQMDGMSLNKETAMVADDLDCFANVQDKVFKAFSKRVSQNPEQVMPRLLAYLDVDSLERSIDWATVALYTCSKNCPPPDGGYAKEFVWKQDYNR